MGRDCSKNRTAFTGLFGLLALFGVLSPAYAIERDETTLRFIWGDDLNASGGSATAASRQIKPTHLPQIREAIDRLTTDCGVTADPWFYTDAQTVAQIGSPGATISSAQLNNLRRAIEELYRQKSMTTPSEMLGNVISGEPIDKPHVQDMRSALDNVAVTCPILGNCGNGALNAGEQCDDNNTTDGDGCNSSCQTESTCVLGPAEQYGETSCPGPDQKYPICDTGWAEGTVVTLPNARINASGICYLPFDCGSYYGHVCTAGGSCVADDVEVPTAAGGVCDSAGVETIPWSQCCSGEAKIICPAPNEPATAMCKRAGTACGNGIVESGEQCDDSNTTSDDGCSATCQTETACGSCNWVWNGINWDDYCNNGCFCNPASSGPPGTGDPQTQNCSCYGATCTGPVCGNNAVESGEQCDDGNTANNDGCSSTCQTESSCWPDGYVYNKGGSPVSADTRVTEERCCAGSAICTGGTTSCSCGGNLAVCWCRELGFGGTTGCDTVSACFATQAECSAATGPSGPCSGFGLTPCVAETNAANCSAGGASIPYCGDGAVAFGEDCDLGSAGNGACPKTCSATCTDNSCGSGDVCGDCACSLDEGMGGTCPGDCDCFTGSACFSSTCSGGGSGGGGAVCGDGAVEGTEQCDDNGLNGSCPRNCSASCTFNDCGGWGGGGGGGEVQL